MAGQPPPAHTGRFSLAGKVALVTGASGGLGAAMAAGLAQAGAAVAAHGNSRSPDATCRGIEAAGGRALAVSGDLGRPDVPQQLVARCVEELGGLDILINNAGMIHRAPAAEYPDEEWLRVLDVNLTGVFRLSRAAGRHFLATGTRGKIVNIASLLSFQGGIRVPAYAASKGAVAQLTKALANEWAAHGINVNAIAPGYMRTDNTAALQADPVRNRQILERIPAGRWGEPDDLVGAAIFLCAPASDYVSGHVLAVDGGWLGR